VDYKDPEALRRECEEGRRLGFDGKVCTAASELDAEREDAASSDPSTTSVLG
jgi:citrate lyase beta subunit